MAADTFSGYFGNLNDQVWVGAKNTFHLCSCIQSIPLQRGSAAPCTLMNLPGSLLLALHM